MCSHSMYAFNFRLCCILACLLIPCNFLSCTTAFHLPAMAPTTWIYSLSKQELVDELQLRSTDTSGSFAELRRRLVAFVAALPDHGTFSQRLLQRLPRRFNVVAHTDELAFPATDAVSRPDGAVPPVQGVEERCAAELPVRVDVPSQAQLNTSHNSAKLNMSVITDLVATLQVIDGTNPTDLCNFLIQATSFFDLELLPLDLFVKLVVSRTTGQLSRDLIATVRGATSWEQFCKNLMEAVCPHLIREDLALSHINRYFQKSNETFDNFVDHIFQAARVLGSKTSETALVEICIRNMLPSNKLHLSFINKPVTRQDLKLIGSELANALFIQQVAGQPQHITPTPLPQSSRMTNVSSNRNTNGNYRTLRCWVCGVPGHRKDTCPTRSANGCRQPPPSGNEFRVRKY